MPNNNSNNTVHHVRLAFAIGTRIVCLAFAVLAVFAIPEARHYLKDEVVGHGDTIYMPLIICKPASLEIEGTVVAFDVAEIQGCHTLSFLANACAMSLVFAICAIIVFGVADILARRGSTRIPGAVVGMAMFLIFILLQTAVSTWALASESKFWEDYYQFAFDELKEYFNSFGYHNIRMHGNTWMLMATGSVAVLAAALLTLETFLMFCYRRRGRPCEEGSSVRGSDDDEENPATTKGKRELPSDTPTSLEGPSSDMNVSKPFRESSERPPWASPL